MVLVVVGTAALVLGVGIVIGSGMETRAQLRRAKEIASKVRELNEARARCIDVRAGEAHWWSTIDSSPDSQNLYYQGKEKAMLADTPSSLWADTCSLLTDS